MAISKVLNFGSTDSRQVHHSGRGWPVPVTAKVTEADRTPLEGRQKRNADSQRPAMRRWTTLTEASVRGLTVSMRR